VIIRIFSKTNLYERTIILSRLTSLTHKILIYAFHGFREIIPRDIIDTKMHIKHTCFEFTFLSYFDRLESGLVQLILKQESKYVHIEAFFCVWSRWHFKPYITAHLDINSYSSKQVEFKKHLFYVVEQIYILFSDFLLQRIIFYGVLNTS